MRQSRGRVGGSALAWILCLLSSLAGAQELPVVRVAVLAYGTVNWELSALKEAGLDRAHGFRLETLPLAGMTATRTALKSGAVDMAVADWFWVARQRATGSRFQLLPFSSSVGKLMVAADAPMQSLEDLRGKRLGIAGGPLSKGWLLLRAVALEQGWDPADSLHLQFGAPPLLNAALRQGQLDALVTFWHYAARLEARGFRVLTDLDGLGERLGLKTRLPLLGYVFAQDWAEHHPGLVAAFNQARRDARSDLAESDEPWTRLRPRLRAPDEGVYLRLRQGYLAGTPEPLTEAHLADARRLFARLAELGGRDLVGPASALDLDVFWRPEP